MAQPFERNIFTTGEYVEQFHPEDTTNPFHRIYEQKRVEVIAAARAFLGENAAARVLDVGGGMGRIAAPLAAHYDVTLCDVSQSMLDLARAAADRAQVDMRLTTQLVDASQPLPYADGSFDLVVCLDLLVHLPDPQAAVREIARVLKPDGVAMIDNSNSIPLWTLFYPSYVGRRPSRWLRTMRAGGVLPEWAGIVHHHTRAEFLRMLAAAGFVVQEERSYGPAICPKWNLAIAHCSPAPVVAAQG
jgi:ubiquinone/menaquinone biosynthesis C-methylase UbiE